jgi:hypothetical protein
MAIVPQAAFPIVSASAGVYDRSIERCRRGGVMDLAIWLSPRSAEWPSGS